MENPSGRLRPRPPAVEAGTGKAAEVSVGRLTWSTAGLGKSAPQGVDREHAPQCLVGGGGGLWLHVSDGKFARGP